MDQIASMVTAESILQWIIILCIVGFFIYKEWPEFKRRITKGAKDEAKAEERDESTKSILNKINERLAKFEDNQTKNYRSIQALQREEKMDRRLFDESIKEREILMKGMLALIDGVQELGADGSTEQAKKEIIAYMSKQSDNTDVLSDEL